MTTSAADVPAELRLERTGDRQFRVAPQPESEIHRNVVFGGEILGRMMVASHTVAPGKAVKSIHGVFARPGRYELPLEFEVEAIHSGRAFASDTVTMRQDGKIATRALILLHGEEPDLIRHGSALPAAPRPEACRRYDIGPAFPGTEQRVVGDADFRKPGSSDEPKLLLWLRSPVAGGSPIVNQAIIAWNTVGMLIGTAMLPHPEIDLTQAHSTISTGPLSHTVNFHEAADPGQWLLFSHESIYAGGGRTHGRGLVFSEDGRLVASFTQDNMVRHFGDGREGPRDSSRAM